MSAYKAVLGNLLEPDSEGRRGAPSGLGTGKSFIVPLSSSQVRQESVGSGAQETRGRTEVEGRSSTLPGLEHNAEGQVSSNLERQVAALQSKIQHLRQQLRVQKGCNEELLDCAIDSQTRERFLQAQVEDLETKLFRSEELREQRLAEHLQKADRGAEENARDSKKPNTEPRL